MTTRKYCFPELNKNHPMFYVWRTSKQLIAFNDEIVGVFKKYAKESYPESPRQILYLMTRHNESVFAAIENESTSPKGNSSPESSSPRKRKAKVSSLKRKKLPFDTSAKPENLENKGSIKIVKKDNVQELSSPSANIKMSETPDTTAVIIEFKRPATPIKDGTDESSLAKRPKLTDTADIDIPSKQTENLETEGLVKTMEKDDVQELTSSSASIKTSENSDTSEVIQTTEFKRPASPIKDGTEEASIAKRPKLIDTADIDIPSKQTESPEAKGSIEPKEKDDVKESASPCAITISEEQTMEKDDDQESTSSSAQVKMSEYPDVIEVIQNIESTSPFTSIKDGTEESNLAKSLKLSDTTDTDVSSKQIENPETVDSINTTGKDDVQESNLTSASIKRPEKQSATEIQNIEFEKPATPIKDGTEEASSTKSPKLADSADIDIPNKQTETLETEGSIKTMGKDDVQESASSKMSEKQDTIEVIQNIESKSRAPPIKDGNEKSNLDESPKLTDTADIDILYKQIENSETEDSIKAMEIDDDQESTIPSSKIKISEKTDTTEVLKIMEFKRPASPVKDGTEESSLAKRPRLTDTADIDVPSKQTENPETEDFIKTMEKDNVQESACSKRSESPDSIEVIETIEFKRPATPIKDGTEKSSIAKRPRLSDIAYTDIPSKQTVTPIPSTEDNKMDLSPIISDKRDLSPEESKLPENIRLLIKTIPILEEGEIEFDMSSRSKQNLEEIEIHHLVDDPSQVESVRKVVEDRLKEDVVLKKSKDRSPSRGNASNWSPRRSRRTRSPGKDTEKILGSDDPDIICTHPSVLEYLKVRFSLVKKYRHKYMLQILESLKSFQRDLLFLYFYAKTASLMVKNTPIEDKEYFTQSLKNLQNVFVYNVKKVADKLRSSVEALNSDILFWTNGLKKIRKLAAKNEPLIPKTSDPEKSVPLLRKYESDLRKIWEQMDSRILLRNGLRSALLEMSTDYAKVAEDYIKYLVMTEILKPSVAPTAEEVQEN